MWLSSRQCISRLTPASVRPPWGRWVVLYMENRVVSFRSQLHTIVCAHRPIYLRQTDHVALCAVSFSALHAASIRCFSALHAASAPMPRVHAVGSRVSSVDRRRGMQVARALAATNREHARERCAVCPAESETPSAIPFYTRVAVIRHRVVPNKLTVLYCASSLFGGAIAWHAHASRGWIEPP